ncbi:hypothetical protein BJ742DRAFT_404215 [Cladochytrium replicatum]|nr:hypothetical protein BJ742DRAFT_404215 [Cladochytrium replicatum]
MARLWLTQVNALLVKNLLTAKRSPLFPLIVLLFPPLLSAILVSFHANHNSSADSSAVTRPSPTPISQLHFNCNTTGKCPVLFYAPNDAYHTSIMARLASMTGMKVGESMTGFATYDDMSVAFFENAGELTSPDLYFAAIAWTSEDVVPGAKFPNVTAYNVWEDSGPPVEYQEGMGHILKRNRNENPEFAKNIGLQIALESAAVSVISELSRGGAPISAMMDVSIDWLNVGPKTGKPEPVTPNFESTDWSSRTRNEAYNAPLTFFIPLYPIVLFCYTLYSVCREKQDDHLVSMKMMGLHESSFWVSSAVIPLVLNFFSTMASALILILAGGFVGWPLLQSIDVPSMWLLQFSFGCSMIATALFLSSIVMKTSSAYGTVVVYFIIHCAVPAPVFGEG